MKRWFLFTVLIAACSQDATGTNDESDDTGMQPADVAQTGDDVTTMPDTLTDPTDARDLGNDADVASDVGDPTRPAPCPAAGFEPDDPATATEGEPLVVEGTVIAQTNRVSVVPEECRDQTPPGLVARTLNRDAASMVDQYVAIGTEDDFVFCGCPSEQHEVCAELPLETVVRVRGTYRRNSNMDCAGIPNQIPCHEIVVEEVCSPG